MEWNAPDVALLRALWTKGRSAGQIATRLGHSRNAVCAKLLRMGLKRGHKPPTAKPKIVSAPKPRPIGAPVAASPSPVPPPARPVPKPDRRRLGDSGPVLRPIEFTKDQLYAMLAEAVANTSRLPR
ncbi:GcrA family cell cycle regulator [Bradyrhizobium sp.]|uniref:GcrA family cell cycle regulator n=1 Tax=Bradyrhizobium sp. TaxID=376 RepID=UPI003C2356A3